MIEKAATLKKVAPTRKHHSSALISYLRSYLGRPEIPDPDYATLAQSEELQVDDLQIAMSRSLNWIYFGPPGTGKTWSALHEVRRLLLVKNIGAAEASQYTAALRQANKAELKRLAALLEGAGEQKESRYWWVTANPAEWTWEELFRKKAQVFRRGRIQRNYEEIAERRCAKPATSSKPSSTARPTRALRALRFPFCRLRKLC